MTWFKVDDGLHGHPKGRAAGLSALGLWVAGGSYSSHQLLDGYVPAWQVDSWKGGARAAARLVEVGLWVPDPRDGFLFHDWKQSNPLRAEVLAAREKAAKRQKKWRDEHLHPDGSDEEGTS